MQPAPQPSSDLAKPAGSFDLRAASIIFATALGLRLVHVLYTRHAPFFDALMGDARGYDAWAQRIAGGDWLGQGTFYQAPLYPYFLGAIYAAAGRDILLVRICQAVLGAAACALLGAAAARLFSRRAGLVAGLSLAVYAPAIFFDGLIQKSALDMFFVCLVLWLLACLVDRRPAAPLPWTFAGMAMGALALTRENALVLAAVVLAWALLRRGPRGKPISTRPGPADRRRPDYALRASSGYGGQEAGPHAPGPVPAKRRAGKRSEAGGADDAGRGPVSRRGNYIEAAAFVLGLALVLLPVVARNYVVGGEFHLTTSQFGPNFYIGNNPRADGTYASLRFGRGTPEFERQDAAELAEQAQGRRLTPGEVSAYWTGRALDFIVSDPAAWVRLLGRKMLLLSNAREPLDTESQESHAEWSPVLRWSGWAGHFGILAPVALFGAWILWPERKRLWVFYAMAAAYLASAVMFYVMARYRLPLVPMLMLFAAAGVDGAPAWIGRARPAVRMRAAAALAAVAIVANWPLLSPALMQAVTENNLGVAFQAEGRLEEAATHYRKAIDLSPDYASPHYNLGIVLDSQGRVDEAIQAYRKAIAIRPDYAEAHYNLGVRLQERGDPQAAGNLREYIRLRPGDVNAASASHLLGRTLASHGRLEEAAVVFRQLLARDPHNADARSAYGDLLLRQGKPEEAAREFREYITLVPGNAVAHHNLGLAFVGQGLEREAVEPFSRAAELQPGNPAYHEDRGHALAAVGRLDEAVASYTVALKLAPTDVDLHNALAVALATQGQRQQASALFRRSLELDPSNPQTRRDMEAVGIR